jgi:NADH-quinone oxidoreductase subunit H
MNLTINTHSRITIFPGGLSCWLLVWLRIADRKLVARFQNRIGPRWFQPLADWVKLLAKKRSSLPG